MDIAYIGTLFMEGPRAFVQVHSCIQLNIVCPCARPILFVLTRLLGEQIGLEGSLHKAPSPFSCLSNPVWVGPRWSPRAPSYGFLIESAPRPPLLGILVWPARDHP